MQRAGTHPMEPMVADAAAPCACRLRPSQRHDPLQAGEARGLGGVALRVHERGPPAQQKRCRTMVRRHLTRRSTMTALLVGVLALLTSPAGA